MSAQVNITPDIGKNIPVDHIREHKPTKSAPTGKALDQLKDILKQIDTELDDSARVRVGAWVRNFMLTLYGGVRATWGVYNVQQGAWDTLPEQDMGRLYNVNMLLQDFTTLKATLERSRIKLKVTPAAAKATDIKAKMSAEVAQRKVDHDLRTEVDADFLSREFTYMLCCGTYARYRGFDKSKGPLEQSALLEDETVKQPGMFYCQNMDCGASGPTDQMQDDMCPQCQGPTVQSEGDILQSKAHTGYEESPSGQCVTYSVNPFELGMPNEATGPDKAAFVRWEQRTRINYIAYKYGVKPSILKGGEVLGPALTALMTIQNYGQSISLVDKNFGVFRRYWLEPFMYSEVENLEDGLKLAGGTVLPKGKLTEYAPMGCYVAKMGDVFLDIQPAKASDCWSGGQYHHHPMSPYGRGIDDGADIQEWESEILSIKIEHAQRDSVGILLYKDSVGIDQSKLVGGANVKVSLPDPEADINKSVMQVNPNPLSGALDSTAEMGKEAMAGVMAAYDVMSGSNENVPNTATGISLLQEKATGVQGQFLARWAASWCIWAIQGLRWAKKYQSTEQFIPFTDPNDSEAGKWFKASDLENDYCINAEEDSWMPRTRLDALADFERMVTLLGALAPLAKNPDQLPDISVIFSHYADLLGVPSDIDATRRDQQVARAIIDKVKAACAMLDKRQPPVTPQEYPALQEQMLTMPSIKALPAMGSEQVFITAVQNELKDLLDDGDGDDQPSELLVNALMGLIDAGKQAMVQNAQEQGQLAAAVQPQEPQQPPPPDPAQVEAAKQQTEAVKQDAETERQTTDIEHQSASQAADLVNAQADREAEAKKTETQQQHDREMALLKMSHEHVQAEKQREHDEKQKDADRGHALKMQKAKPKPQPGPKK